MTEITYPFTIYLLTYFAFYSDCQECRFKTTGGQCLGHQTTGNPITSNPPAPEE